MMEAPYRKYYSFNEIHYIDDTNKNIYLNLSWMKCEINYV